MHLVAVASKVLNINTLYNNYTNGYSKLLLFHCTAIQLYHLYFTMKFTSNMFPVCVFTVCVSTELLKTEQKAATS